MPKSSTKSTKAAIAKEDPPSDIGALKEQITILSKRVDALETSVKSGGKVKPAKDKNAPKKPKNSYSFYNIEMGKKLMKDEPDLKLPDRSKKIGKMWGEMTEAQKKPYEALAAEDKKRYANEMSTYVKKD